MYDPASMRLEVPVRENLAVHLKVGDELTMSIDVLGDELKAPIDEITGQAELASRSFLVKWTLPNHANLAEGMTGRVRIPAGIRRHLCLPIEAVPTIGQLNFVDVVRDDNTIERRFIQLGRFGYPGRIEVLSGVKAEELVLLGTARKTAVQDNG
ncbi:MAG: hypothetical protein JW829_08665 [Pirellulales bacterium]|nr:hypothetical protein [Pirellulales bacterium]